MVYKPAGVPLADMERMELFHDQLEALHLCDGEGMTQEQAGACMGVSRGTVQRLVTEARHTVARALVRQTALVIRGVDYDSGATPTRYEGEKS